MAKTARDSRLTALIDCGRAGDYGAIATELACLCPFDEDLLLAAAQRMHAWLDEQLIAKDEVAPLAKVLMVAENGALFRTGSTNKIYRVAHLIDESDLDWLYRHAVNPYIPFGSSGKCRKAPSVDAYRKCEELMRLERELAKLQRQVRLAKKRFDGSVRLDAMRKIQAERTARRNNLIDKLRTASVGDRLVAITTSAQPIYYFPREFAEIPRDAGVNLSPELLQHLAEKLARAKRGPWRRLTEQLFPYQKAFDQILLRPAP